LYITLQAINIKSLNAKVRDTDFISHLLPVTGVLTPFVDASNEKITFIGTIILLVNKYVFKDSLVNLI